MPALRLGTRLSLSVRPVEGVGRCQPLSTDYPGTSQLLSVSSWVPCLAWSNPSPVDEHSIIPLLSQTSLHRKPRSSVRIWLMAQSSKRNKTEVINSVITGHRAPLFQQEKQLLECLEVETQESFKWERLLSILHFKLYKLVNTPALAGCNSFGGFLSSQKSHRKWVIR